MKRMRLNFILWMLILGFGLAVLLLPITAAYSQPTNPVGSLVFDTLVPGKDHVIECEIKADGVDLPTNECQYNPLNGETKVANVNGTYTVGPHTFQVRVHYEAYTYTDPDTGAETVFNEGWSGWSNTAQATKPEVLALTYVDGYIVTEQIPQGADSGDVYINDTQFAALMELSPDQRYLRLFDVGSLNLTEPTTLEVYANMTVIGADGKSSWAGEFQAVPFVVTVGVALQAPANLHLR